MRLRLFVPTGAALVGFLSLAADVFPAGPPPIQESLERAVREFPGTLGVAAKNLDTGEAFAVNGDARLPTASLTLRDGRGLPSDRRGRIESRGRFEGERPGASFATVAENDEP